MTTSLRVLIDATAIPRDLGGVGRYLQFLIPALSERDDIELLVVAQAHDAQWMSEAAPRARIIPVPARLQSRARRLVWEQLSLPALARRERADVLHSPHYTMPVLSRVPTVVTLHDGTFFSHPELHSRFKRVFFRFWTRYSSRRAAALVVPSEATGTELRRMAGLPAAKEFVAYHGVDRSLFDVPSAEAIAAAAAALGLPSSGWLSFLGTVEPRKNVANLVRAYAALAGEGAVPPLVIAGARGWDEETGAVVGALPAGIDVRLPGYVDAELLAGLLGGSVVFAYPSLGEGFGLPVLEAMACGAPTLTTRELALPEVGGDAVEYTGLTAEEIEASLRALLADAARRAELAAAGPVRAAEFSWQRSAEAHVRAFLSASPSRVVR